MTSKGSKALKNKTFSNKKKSFTDQKRLKEAASQFGNNSSKLTTLKTEKENDQERAFNELECLEVANNASCEKQKRVSHVISQNQIAP